MKLNKKFLILLFILFALCVILYFVQTMVFREGLSSDTNEDAIVEAQKFENDPNYAGDSGYIKILPLKSTVVNTPSKDPLMSSYPDLTDLPINEYVVKSSYNSACSGSSNNISNEMLMYTLSRGCRFIDFEISNIGGEPYVVSPDYKGPVKINKNKICKLTDILKTAVTYGLTDANGHAPNYTDPLFIHLRINPDPSYNDLYSDVGRCIQTNIKNFLYKTGKNIDSNKTKMKDIMGKAVIIMNSNYNPEWKNIVPCNGVSKNCVDLINLIHLESGNNKVTLNSPSLIKNTNTTPILKNSNGINVDNEILRIILPDSDIGLLNTDKSNLESNPDFENIVTKWSCNFITNRFYIRDQYLIDYEKFFNIQRLAIVPLAYVYDYFLSEQ